MRLIKNQQTPKELQDLVDKAKDLIANKKKDTKKKLDDLLKKADGEGDITAQDLESIDGINGPFTPEELKAINELLDKADPKPTTLQEWLALINKAKDEVKKIKELNEKADGEGDITAQDLESIDGINGPFTPEELKAINELFDKADPKPSTLQEWLDLINKAKEMVDKIDKNYVEVVEDINGNKNGINVTAEQLNNIDGVSGAIDGVDYTTALQNYEFKDKNHPTPQEIQAVIDSVNNSKSKFRPLMVDAMGKENIHVGYEVGDENNIAEITKIEVVPSLKDKAKIEIINEDGEEKIEIAVVTTPVKNVKECSNYAAYMVMSVDGGVQTGYKCGDEIVDPTQKDNIRFVPGTHSRVYETTQDDKLKHSNAEIVIINDAVLPMNEEIIIDNK